MTKQEDAQGMNSDDYSDIIDTMAWLRQQAAEARHTAQGLRDSACHHDGKAEAFDKALEQLQRIELPQ